MADKKKLRILALAMLSIGAFLFSLGVDKLVIGKIFALRSPMLDSIFIAIGSYYVFYVLIAGPAIFMLLKNRKNFWNFIYTVAGAYFLSLLLKYIIHRPRPLEENRLLETIIESDPSFPSTHATIFFAMATLLSFLYPKHKYWILGVAAVITFTRLYLGLHYLSDVVAGGMMGVFIGYYFCKRKK